MDDLPTADGDRLLPIEIEHRCEDMFNGDRLMQRYNYVVYHFENGGHYYWARAYLEDIDTVALFGPFDNRATRRPAAGQIDADVLAYLQRRFQEIQALGDEGYKVIWSRDH